MSQRPFIPSDTIAYPETRYPNALGHSDRHIIQREAQRGYRPRITRRPPPRLPLVPKRRRLSLGDIAVFCLMAYCGWAAVLFPVFLILVCSGLVRLAWVLPWAR